ncbi:hydroxysqualene dehydroxylase [Acaryochloris thomasi]|nr:FAD-dependent oxidoreductase [Acaryochloris thomasi]
MKKRVVVLGGGVAGMSAAHELAERGFDVAVYDARDLPGGKARSIPVPDSGKNGKLDLPGEHGFRFFPGFYQHVTDTMKRIPYINGSSVFDNLVDATQISIPRLGKETIVMPAKSVTSLTDVRLLVNVLLQLLSNQGKTQIQISEEEISFFTQKLWKIITSCKERRLAEYEKIDWWNFLEADKFASSDSEYVNLLVKGLTESLVASKAKLASTKTVGDILLELLLDLANPTITTDRLLSGPTNKTWLSPWLSYLQSLGVNYHLNNLVTSLNYAAGKIESATIKDIETNEKYEVQADYFIAALPVEVMAKLVIKSNLGQHDRALANITKLTESVAWMNGIQFYLSEDVRIAKGHILLVDTPWALTAISQKQFWPDVDLSQYGDGRVKGILSVDISDWGPFPGLDENRGESQGIKIKKFARDCTDAEIKEEVWEQLKQSLNVGGYEVLKDEHLLDDLTFLDPDIVDIHGELFPEKSQLPSPNLDRELYRWIEADKTAEEIAQATDMGLEEISAELDALVELGFIEEIINNNGKKTYNLLLPISENQLKINLEPLLVNLVDTWKLRPQATTQIPNLLLASDYVQTNTDLATMEGANEAARRAVNAILKSSGSTARPCRIWDICEPKIFAPLRLYDQLGYQKGLTWEETWEDPTGIMKIVIP